MHQDRGTLWPLGPCRSPRQGVFRTSVQTGAWARIWTYVHRIGYDHVFEHVWHVSEHVYSHVAWRTHSYVHRHVQGHVYAHVVIEAFRSPRVLAHSLTRLCLPRFLAARFLLRAWLLGSAWGFVPPSRC